MEDLKVHIQDVMLWELKNNKNAIETTKKTFRIYSQGAITECQIQNWFLKLHSGDISLRAETKPGCSLDLKMF